MNKLQVFNHEYLGNLEIVTINGNPWFGGNDVAKMLGYSNPRDAVARHCRKDGVVKHDVIDSMGRQQQINIISEGNMYRLISGSKLPSAEVFEAWVFDEVLPTIRKHGMYATDDLLNDPDLLIKVATELKTERAARQRLEAEAKVAQPMIIFANAVTASHTSILIGELAKIIKQNGYDIGGTRLFGWMRDNGYLIRRKGTDYNMPTQRAMEMGLFEIKETAITHSDGHVSISKTTKVTGKGQVYFINKFNELKLAN